jgi:hypothetical protein
MNYRSNFGNPVAVNHDRLLWVRDLPDADGPGYVSLNGGFGETNRSRRPNADRGGFEMTSAKRPFVARGKLTPTWFHFAHLQGPTFRCCSGGFPSHM